MSSMFDIINIETMFVNNKVYLEQKIEYYKFINTQTIKVSFKENGLSSTK